MTRLGLVFVPTLAPERLREVAQAADRAGLEELWLWEDCFKESGIAAASAALAWTDRLHVGIGLLPVPLRNVALTAMEIATVERLFPGRLVPGVGHGVQEWMSQVGARAASPLTLLREYTTALRALLAGQRVSTQGRYVRLDDVALDWPPASAPELLGGGVGPKSLTLCAELCDGTILTGGMTVEQVRSSCATVRAARASAGLTGPHRIVVFVITATGDGAAERLDVERERWALDESASGGADVGVAGDAAAVAAAYSALLEAGADTIVAQPTADESDLESLIRFVATDVRTLLAT
jgi:alkanesulfonate monooxygenase SsuD/methylene tetrahydromethanopterin reductase-like flavin-dependent oxidoreductase (luciferase family)